MKIEWRKGSECECGEAGCFATAAVLLPNPIDPWLAFAEASNVRSRLATRVAGGVRSRQDPRTNGAA